MKNALLGGLKGWSLNTSGLKDCSTVLRTKLNRTNLKVMEWLPHRHVTVTVMHLVKCHHSFIIHFYIVTLTPN